MKQRLLCFIVASVLTTSPALASGGIPTLDVGALIQNIQQIENQVNQILEMKRQVEALTSKSGIGEFFRENVDNLPEDWKTIYNSITNIDLKRFYNGERVNVSKVLYATQNAVETVNRDIRRTYRRIDSLQRRIDSTANIKDSADLQARIQVEQAKLANQQMKVQQVYQELLLAEKINEKQLRLKHKCISLLRANQYSPECS